MRHFCVHFHIPFIRLFIAFFCAGDSVAIPAFLCTSGRFAGKWPCKSSSSCMKGRKERKSERERATHAMNKCAECFVVRSSALWCRFRLSKEGEKQGETLAQYPLHTTLNQQQRLCGFREHKFCGIFLTGYSGCIFEMMKWSSFVTKQFPQTIPTIFFSLIYNCFNNNSHKSWFPLF